MKQLFFRGGRPVVLDTDPPGPEPGRVLVDVHYSAVSPGTEGALLRSSGRSFLSLALEKRRRADRLVDALRRRDLSDVRRRFERLAQRSQAWYAPGYSAAGCVRAVGTGVSDFAPGDRVAVAGAGYAAHADQVVVPRNLVVRVPPALDLAPASTVALGAIALQSVRRSDARLGETVLVLGLGFLGQSAARILFAGGCRVLGWDPLETRRRQAGAHGVEILAVDDLAGVASAALASTAGRGVDASIVAAAGGAALCNEAARAVRRSGVLVLLGQTPVLVGRDIAYERELTVRMSTSYGPGRYDTRYEEEGIDYPFAHVRWTENRNMEAWLELLASERVRIGDLLGPVRNLEEAAQAYLHLRADPTAPPGFVFHHPAASPGAPRVIAPESAAAGAPGPAAAPASTPASSGAVPPVEPHPRRPPLGRPLRVALLGTGGYAAAGILPALVPLGDRIRLDLLVGSVPSRREPLARRFGFARSSSDYRQGAVDPDVDLVIIATRHDLHADLVMRALAAGRAVFCEKPLALSEDDLDRIAAEHAARNAFLAVGLNRRFAPAVTRLQTELAGRRGPLQISYRVQAGPLPEDHWLRGPQGGGRLVGEAVHMIDLLRVLAGAPLQSAWIVPGGAGSSPAADDFQVGFRYQDGSTATLLYTARGAAAHPKERIEVHWDGRTAELTNFAGLTESGRRNPLWAAPEPRKGQVEMWRACVAALLGGGAEPAPLDEVLESHRTALALERSRRSG